MRKNPRILEKLLVRGTLTAGAMALAACTSFPGISPPAPDLGRPWALAGYLPENPGERVWITMENGRIAAVSAVRPALPPAQIHETDATIFPGFVDLNANLSSAGLPISPLPRAQYRNRAEWYYKQSKFYAAQARVPGPPSSSRSCAALRWGEIRGLSGGTAFARGMPSRELTCAEDFGLSNLESPRDFPGGRIVSEERAVIPSYMEKVFVPLLLPHLEKGASYEQAFRQMLVEQKVTAWVSSFREDTHNIPNALKLLMGNDFGLAPEAMAPADFKMIAGKVEKFLAGAPYRLKPAAVTEQLARTEAWIFGSEEEAGFLKGNRTEQTAFAFLAKPGVLIFEPALRKYIGDFEAHIRGPLAASLNAPGTRAVFLALGQGARDDAYSRDELSLARHLGYVKPGLVINGGSAYGEKEFSELAKNDISLVWSPFSDLLLYGDSLDVVKAKAAGINITLGTGNAAAGAKNLLDQLKIARAYLNGSGGRGVSNRELIDMVTKNAAVALRAEGELGVVKAGALANLTLLKCSAAKDPYDCALAAKSAEISLVVAGGVPRYGSPEILGDLSPDDGREILPFARSEGDCTFRKALLVDASRDTELGSAAKIRKALSLSEDEEVPGAKPIAFTPLAPLFSCQDSDYESRADDFIAIRLPALLQKRDKIRREENLDENWNPLAGGKLR
ncbi:MAG: hypothetical protein EOP11_00975 [Proteobacteria bacterium]|nr:MAG: hypothetical protein EOP11_00975 [Pseudomonadota bacterium]